MPPLVRDSQHGKKAQPTKDFRFFLVDRNRDVQSSRAVTRTDHAGIETRAEQQGERIRVDAAPVHLQGGIEVLRLCGSNEGRGLFRLIELFCDPGDAGKGKKIVEIRTACGKLSQQRERDERDFGLRQGVSQCAKSRNSADEVSDARGAKHRDFETLLPPGDFRERYCRHA